MNQDLAPDTARSLSLLVRLVKSNKDVDPARESDVYSLCIARTGQRRGSGDLNIVSVWIVRNWVVLETLTMNLKPSGSSGGPKNRRAVG